VKPSLIFGLAAIFATTAHPMAFAADLVREDFAGSGASPLAGAAPTLNLPAPTAVWSADPVFSANGQVNDGTNTDRGAYLDLGPDFAFKPNETYTLVLGWTNLDNAILFAGFSNTAPNPNAAMQTQGTNFALRARRITAGTDTLAAWKNPGASANPGTIATPATGSATLTLHTRTLSDATFTIDGLDIPVAIDLSGGFRYLWIGFEDPASTSPASDARFTQLRFSGPDPETPPLDPAVVTILPETTLVPPGTTVTLSANPPDATVRFTLDGSPPDANSQVFNAPVTLTNSATIRAIAFRNGTPGPESSRSFTLQEPFATAPNLLLIIGDDVGYGDLQCYGGPTIATPALDSLAYGGIRFTQFTTAGPGNFASQYALMTGRVAARSGLGNAVPPGAPGWQAEEWSLAEMLRRRGFSTAFIGEWHLGNANGSHPNDQGFQLFHGLPFPLAQGPPLVENRNVLEAVATPANLLEQLAVRAESRIATAEQPFALIFQCPALAATGTSIGGPHGRRIEALDSTVARLLTALETRGATANTLVVFLGDGGTTRSADGGSNGLFRDGSGTTWEGGLRTPMIARLPGTLPAGQMNLSLLWLPDLMPTLASLLGGDITADRPLDGTPRPAVLKGTRTVPAGDETALSFRFQNNAYQLTTVRKGRWKSHLSIVNVDPQNTNPLTGSQLYDLHVDAEERINRATQQPAVLTELQSLATALSAQLPAPGSTDLPPPKPALRGAVSTRLESSGRNPRARFLFTRPLDSIDDNYRIEHSTDLESWQSLAIEPFKISCTPVPGFLEDIEIHVETGAPPLDGSSRFLRLGAGRASNP
jgi:arylsulfatase A-like enzyme